MQWHTPIGYKVLNGKIVVYEEHRKIVEQIFRDYDSGISALRIAKDLKDRGIKNAHDRVGWSHASIGRILENYNYLGTEDYEQENTDRTKGKGSYSAECCYVQSADAPTAIFSHTVRE